MQSYTIEFNGSGEVCEGHFGDDIQAYAWVETVIAQRGHDSDEVVFGEWDADGKNDDGEPCYRMLIWADEEAAKNDSGANSICQLCKVGS